MLRDQQQQGESSARAASGAAALVQYCGLRTKPHHSAGAAVNQHRRGNKFTRAQAIAWQSTKTQQQNGQLAWQRGPHEHVGGEVEVGVAEVRRDPARQLVALVVALVALVRKHHHAVVRLRSDDAPDALRRLHHTPAHSADVAQAAA